MCEVSHFNSDLAGARPEGEVQMLPISISPHLLDLLINLLLFLGVVLKQLLHFYIISGLYPRKLNCLCFFGLRVASSAPIRPIATPALFDAISV